ncbi:hypothetical protein GVAV_000314 [Gurleya vavrai]
MDHLIINFFLTKINFNKRKVKLLHEGHHILNRNETKSGKMDVEFTKKSIIGRRIHANIYELRTEKGAIVRRHVLQTKQDSREGG